MIVVKVKESFTERMKKKKELTKREKEVLKCLIQGKTNRQISDELIITTSTVKAHCKSIFEKFKVSGRVPAVVKALTEGYGDFILS